MPLQPIVKFESSVTKLYKGTQERNNIRDADREPSSRSRSWPTVIDWHKKLFPGIRGAVVLTTLIIVWWHTCLHVMDGRQKSLGHWPGCRKVVSSKLNKVTPGCSNGVTTQARSDTVTADGSRTKGKVIREVLQTESGSIFGKVRVRVLTGQGQSTHEHVRTESLFCKQKIDFRFHFRFGEFRWRSDWGLWRRLWRKPCCSRVTKWQSGLGEEERLFFTLACFARQCGVGLIINEAAAELFYTRESRKRRVNGKGTKEKEDYLYVDDSWRRLSSPLSLSLSPVVFLLLFPSPFHPLLSTNTILVHFFRLSHDTVRGRDRWFRNSLEFGAGEHTGEDEIDAVELDDLENDDITEEETKRAEVDAASCNPKLPKHMATWAGSNRPAWTEPKILFGSRAL